MSKNSIIKMVMNLLNQRLNKTIFYNSTHYNPSDYDINNLIKTLFNKCNRLFNFLKNSYNINNGEELKDAFISFIENFNFSFIERGHSDSLLYKLQAIDSIIKNPNLINQLYKSAIENINNAQDDPIYTSNLLRAQKLVLTEACKLLYYLEFSIKEGITFDNKLVQKLASTISNQKSRNDKILAILKQVKQEAELSVQELQVQDMQVLYSFFNDLGFLEEYMSLYKKNSQKFGFQDLDYSLNDATDSNTISLREVFSEDYLKSLSIQDLSFFYTFWNNRFAKECNSLSSAFLCIDSLNLWDDFFDGNTNLNLSNEKLIAVLQKANYLRQLFCNTYSLQLNDSLHKEIKEGKPIPHLRKDYSDYYNELYNFIGKDYNNFFSDSLENNDFYEDFCFAKYLINLEMLAYSKKNTVLQPLIKKLLDNPVCKNWGLVRHNYINGEYVDSLASSSSMALLAFDIEGFNMPLRFHVSKDDLINLIRQNNRECIIPEYQGNEDFILNGEFIPTPILMPILKGQRDIIRNNIALGNNANLWEHFQFLMNGKFPPHLTNKVETKNKVVQSRITRKSVSLTTGDEFVEDKNGFRRINGDNIR